MKIPIHDGTIPSQSGSDLPPKEVTDIVEAAHLSNEVLITELWQRGVTIQTIFGTFYALEENASHSLVPHDVPLTVADAELAGLTNPNPPDPKPF